MLFADPSWLIELIIEIEGTSPLDIYGFGALECVFMVGIVKGIVKLDSYHSHH